MNVPLISIIIPTYNRGHLLSETLDSILKQSYEQWECIIVDDGSIDNTKEVIENYIKEDHRFTYFLRPMNKPKGVNSCRNYGLEKAKGQYIQWFDSDDIMYSEKLQQQIELIVKNNFNCVFSNFSYFRGAFEENIKVNNLKPFNSFREESLLLDYISGNVFLNFPNMMCERVLLTNFSLNLKISYAEDIEFIFRLLMNSKIRIGVCESILMYVRKHENSLTDAFKERDKGLINDEIRVRQFVLDTIKESKQNDELLKGSVKMYLKSIKYLLYIREYRAFFKKLFYVFKKVDINLKLVILKLFVLALFYIFTKKGITAYQKMLNKL